MEPTKEKGNSLEQWARREYGTWRCPGSVTDPCRAFGLGVAGGQCLSMLVLKLWTSALTAPQRKVVTVLDGRSSRLQTGRRKA